MVTVEDGTTVGGLGSAVGEWLTAHGKPIPVTRLGVPDRFIDQGTVAQQQAECGIDAASIATTVQRIINTLPPS